MRPPTTTTEVLTTEEPTTQSAGRKYTINELLNFVLNSIGIESLEFFGLHYNLSQLALYSVTQHPKIISVKRARI